MYFFNLDYKCVIIKILLIKIIVVNLVDSFDKRKIGEKMDFFKRRVYVVLKSVNFRFYLFVFV